MNDSYKGQPIGDDVVRMLELLTVCLVVDDDEALLEEVDRIAARFDSLSRDALRGLVDDCIDLAMDLATNLASAEGRESEGFEGPLRAIRDGGWRGWLTSAQAEFDDSQPA